MDFRRKELSVTLDMVYQQIWELLRKAVLDGDRPFKTVQVATVDTDGRPDVRTVLLRNANQQESIVCFHTDTRSPKTSHLKREPHVAIAGFAPDLKQQLRIYGTAEVVLDEHLRLQAWNSSEDRTLPAYRTALPPGTLITQPGVAFSRPASDDDAFSHFCVIRVHVAQIDWLDESVGNEARRATYVRTASHWDASWIAP